MDFFEKILSIDYTDSGLSSIEQLVFIKIACRVTHGLDISAKALCLSCGCSKPTLHLAISKLEDLRFIVVARSPGSSNHYSVNNDLVDSLLPDYVKASIAMKKTIEDFDSPVPELKLTKNQRKRLRNGHKKRW